MSTAELNLHIFLTMNIAFCTMFIWWHFLGSISCSSQDMLSATVWDTSGTCWTGQRSNGLIIWNDVFLCVNRIRGLQIEGILSILLKWDSLWLTSIKLITQLTFCWHINIVIHSECIDTCYHGYQDWCCHVEYCPKGRKWCCGSVSNIMVQRKLCFMMWE